jgi:pimeloyl-ACP methyl ester carboxylesterase
VPAEAGGIYVEHHGGGGPSGWPPLVLLHGAGGSRLHWPPGIRRLAGGDVFALDLPGHGDSAGRPVSTLSGYAEHVLDWIRATALEPVILVGHSMGAAIALIIALRRPQDVAGLVLVGASARLRVAPALLADSATRTGFPKAVDQVVEWSFSASTPRSLIDLARDRMIEAGHTAFHNDFQACENFDVRTRLAEIQVPALVIQGEDDQMTPLSLAEELAAGLPNGGLASLPAVGHMVMLEKPNQVAELLRGFLTAHFPAGEPAAS